MVICDDAQMTPIHFAAQAVSAALEGRVIERRAGDIRLQALLFVADCLPALDRPSSFAGAVGNASLCGDRGGASGNRRP